jgi:hypothetical protein
MTDYIRKAVELADGYKWLHRDQVEIPDLNNAVLRPFEQQWFLDALAAQLVRQAPGVASDFAVYQYPIGVSVVDCRDNSAEREIAKVCGPDRTMNTIKAIVDSGVLSADRGRE